MTRTKDNAKAWIKKEDLQQLLAEDRDLLQAIVEQTVQQILQAEMEEVLQAGKSERTETRLGYRAGYYSRTLITRVGKIELRVLQDRQGRFRTEVFKRYQRSEKALMAAMLEMYGQGVSTRKVKTITEGVLLQLGFLISENRDVKKQSPGRNPLFAKRWFADEVIVMCVRWYLRFRLSYRDLASIAAECGVSVAPSTILRWVIHYTGEFVQRWAPFEQAVGRSWRADETYSKVKGDWMFLCRAVDERGRTAASYLSRTRDQTAARNFFRQALKRHGEPRSITLDGFEPSHTALRRMGMQNEFNFRWKNPVKIRSSKYLNNMVEQDHRRVKFRVSAMLGFKTFQNARIVLAGIELIQKRRRDSTAFPSALVGAPARSGATCSRLSKTLAATEPIKTPSL